MPVLSWLTRWEGPVLLSFVTSAAGAVQPRRPAMQPRRPLLPKGALRRRNDQLTGATLMVPAQAPHDRPARHRSLLKPGRLDS